MNSTPWGIILAGGDGAPRRALSWVLSGDDRPRQYCVLPGNKSLLRHTRDIVAAAISPERILFVVTQKHQRFYRNELADAQESRIVVQPSNRGTTAAIVYSLMRLLRAEEDPVVAVFPSNRQFGDEGQFVRAMNRVFDVVRRTSDLLVLLGIKAERPEPECGWFETGAIVDGDDRGSTTAFRVEQFREAISPQKPEMPRAGCGLWNTSVIAARAKTLLEVCESAVPHTVSAFRLLTTCAPGSEETAAAALYSRLPAGDFAHEVLTRVVSRLAVVPIEGADREDVITPRRVTDALQGTTATGSIATGSNNDACVFAEWWNGYRRRLPQFPPAAGEPPP